MRRSGGIGGGMNRLLVFLVGTVVGYLAGGYLDGLMEEEGFHETEEEA